MYLCIYVIMYLCNMNVINLYMTLNRTRGKYGVVYRHTLLTLTTGSARFGAFCSSLKS